MTYKQLAIPNPNAIGYIGECEAFAEAFFRASQKEPTARAAWDAAQFKHPGEEPPAGVVVPMFWDYLNPEDGNNDGHVAGSLGDGRIQSSPWQQGTTYAILNSRAQLESIYSDNGTYPLTYLGWSEDISNVRVVEGVTMIEPQTIISTFADFGVPGPDADQIKYYGNHPNGYDELHTDLLKYNYNARRQAEAEVTALKGELDSRPSPIQDVTPPTPLPNLNPMPIPTQIPDPTPPTPADQEKVNIFVALWRALFG